MKKSPHVAVVTNLSPNHLDVHKSMDEYIDAKKNIFINQSPKDKLILNYDNSITKAFASEAKGKVEYFSRQNILSEGSFIKNDCLFYKKGNAEVEIVKADENRDRVCHTYRQQSDEHEPLPGREGFRFTEMSHEPLDRE